MQLSPFQNCSTCKPLLSVTWYSPCHTGDVIAWHQRYTCNSRKKVFFFYKIPFRLIPGKSKICHIKFCFPNAHFTLHRIKWYFAVSMKAWSVCIIWFIWSFCSWSSKHGVSVKSHASWQRHSSSKIDLIYKKATKEQVFLSLPNEIQYTICKLYATEHKVI